MGDFLMATELFSPVVKKRLCIGENEEGHRVTLELEIETKNRSAKTTELKDVTKYKTLSICGESINSSGQMGDDIRANIDTFKLYIPKDRLLRILDIWDQWHLNDMSAACVHQIALGWNTRKMDDSKETGWHVNMANANLAGWVRPEENPKGVLGKPCPECGYKYGTAWLVGALPDEIEQEVLGLFESSSVESQSSESEYQRAAKAFLAKHNLKLIIKEGSGKEPLWGEDREHGNHYRITIKRKVENGTRSLSFDFWDSIANMQEGQKPNEYDICACMSSDCSYPTTADEVIQELGEMPIKQAQATAKFAAKLQGFFSEEELEDLRKIN